jgi:hypothetical protein
VILTDRIGSSGDHGSVRLWPELVLETTFTKLLGCSVESLGTSRIEQGSSTTT